MIVDHFQLFNLSGMDVESDCVHKTRNRKKKKNPCTICSQRASWRYCSRFSMNSAAVISCSWRNMNGKTCVFTSVSPVNLLSCQIRSQLDLTVLHCVETRLYIWERSGPSTEPERRGRRSLAFFETRSTKSCPESSAWCPEAESSMYPGVWWWSPQCVALFHFIYLFLQYSLTRRLERNVAFESTLPSVIGALARLLNQIMLSLKHKQSHLNWKSVSGSFIQTPRLLVWQTRLSGIWKTILQHCVLCPIIVL